MVYLGWEGVDWIQLAQYREQWRYFVNTAKNLRGFIKGEEIFV
jgi:hypothetical protein